MSQLSIIKDRVKTIGNLHKVTRAMEMVTRTKIHRVRQNYLNAKNYQELFAGIFAAISARVQTEVSDAPPKKYYLAFFSHKGFCGGFNDKLLMVLREALHDNPVSLYMLGRSQTKWKHYVQQEYQHISAAEKTYQTETAELITELQSKIYAGKKIEIYFVYNQLVSILEQEPVVQKIYPVKLPAVSGDTLLEPEADVLYPEILRGYLSACLDKIYWESLAGEYYARLLSMKDANENAEIILDNLSVEYNKTRQTRITQELSEVVSAFDVLKMSSEKRGGV